MGTDKVKSPLMADSLLNHMATLAAMGLVGTTDVPLADKNLAMALEGPRVMAQAIESESRTLQ